MIDGHPAPTRASAGLHETRTIALRSLRALAGAVLAVGLAPTVGLAGDPDFACSAPSVALETVGIGRASDAVTAANNSARPITADQGSDTIVFLHQQDITIFGGGTSANGRLRFDLSTNGGTSWTTSWGR